MAVILWAYAFSYCQERPPGLPCGAWTEEAGFVKVWGLGLGRIGLLSAFFPQTGDLLTQASHAALF